MRVRCAVLLLTALPACSAYLLAPATVRVTSRPLPRLVVMAAQIPPPVPKPPGELNEQGGGQESAGGRVAVSGLAPPGQGVAEETKTGVQQPPASEGMRSMGPPSSRPIMLLTLMATVGVAAFQSKRMYRVRQATKLAEFSNNMVFHLGNEKEMARMFSRFRTELGPGKYRVQMFSAFVKQMASEVPLGVKGIQDLKAAAGLFKFSDAEGAAALEKAADDLAGEPSVLGKLVFVAERAMPQQSAMAKLRTKFPKWSFDTVTALQRAMLENLYRELNEKGEEPDANGLQVLGLTEADASRLKAEAAEKKRLEEEEAAAVLEEERKRLRMEAAVKKAAELNADTSSRLKSQDSSTGPEEDDEPPAADEDDDAPAEVGASGTHEFECTDCGYIIFPAAGREFKFFGDDFKCPQCGSKKDAFVDNGPA